MRCIAAVCLLLCGASIVSAQSILDAGRVEFTPSADDGAVDSNGNALVTDYSMAIYVAGDTTVVETVDLGKPSPDSDGFIRVDFMSRLAVALTPGVSYEATVSSVGPGGSSPSARTNTFGLSVSCSFSISPSSETFDAGTASGSFTVSAGSTCQWTAVSQSSWITVTAGAAGSGPGTVSYSVAVNSDTSARTGTILAAGWNFTITQAGAVVSACTYTLSASSLTVAAPAGSIAIAVTADSGCAWTATSPASWARVSAGASGTGAGTVTVTVSRNNGVSARTVTLTIAGQSVALTQQGKSRHK